MIPLFLQAMLEHPSQIIRFGESVIPTVMVYTGEIPYNGHQLLLSSMPH